MRYRRDLPLTLVNQQPDVMAEVVQHIAMHLLGATHPNDDDQGGPGHPPLTLTREPHPDDPTMVSLTGRIDADADAPYLRPGFDPATDHPEIVFTPYENPAAGQLYNRDAHSHWTTHGHHERAEP